MNSLNHHQQECSHHRSSSTTMLLDLHSPQQQQQQNGGQALINQPHYQQQQQQRNLVISPPATMAADFRLPSALNRSSSSTLNNLENGRDGGGGDEPQQQQKVEPTTVPTPNYTANMGNNNTNTTVIQSPSEKRQLERKQEEASPVEQLSATADERAAELTSQRGARSCLSAEGPLNLSQHIQNSPLDLSSLCLNGPEIQSIVAAQKVYNQLILLHQLRLHIMTQLHLQQQQQQQQQQIAAQNNVRNHHHSNFNFSRAESSVLANMVHQHQNQFAPTGFPLKALSLQEREKIQGTSVIAHTGNSQQQPQNLPLDLASADWQRNFYSLLLNNTSSSVAENKNGNPHQSGSGNATRFGRFDQEGLNLPRGSVVICQPRTTDPVAQQFQQQKQKTVIDYVHNSVPLEVNVGVGASKTTASNGIRCGPRSPSANDNIKFECQTEKNHRHNGAGGSTGSMQLLASGEYGNGEASGSGQGSEEGTETVMSFGIPAQSQSRNKLGRSYNPGRPLGMFDRQRILALYQRGLKISHIAKVIGVTHSCVSKIMTRYRRTGSIHPRSAQLSRRVGDIDGSVFNEESRLLLQGAHQNPANGTPFELPLPKNPQNPFATMSLQEMLMRQGGAPRIAAPMEFLFNGRTENGGFGLQKASTVEDTKGSTSAPTIENDKLPVGSEASGNHGFKQHYPKTKLLNWPPLYLPKTEEAMDLGGDSSLLQQHNVGTGSSSATVGQVSPLAFLQAMTEGQQSLKPSTSSMLPVSSLFAPSSSSLLKASNSEPNLVSVGEEAAGTKTSSSSSSSSSSTGTSEMNAGIAEQQHHQNNASSIASGSGGAGAFRAFLDGGSATTSPSSSGRGECTSPQSGGGCNGGNKIVKTATSSTLRAMETQNGNTENDGSGFLSVRVGGEETMVPGLYEQQQIPVADRVFQGLLPNISTHQNSALFPPLHLINPSFMGQHQQQMATPAIDLFRSVISLVHQQHNIHQNGGGLEQTGMAPIQRPVPMFMTTATESTPGTSNIKATADVEMDEGEEETMNITPRGLESPWKSSIREDCRLDATVIRSMRASSSVPVITTGTSSVDMTMDTAEFPSLATTPIYGGSLTVENMLTKSKML